MPGRIYNTALLGSDSQYRFDLMSHLNVQVNDFLSTVTLLRVASKGGDDPGLAGTPRRHWERDDQYLIKFKYRANKAGELTIRCHCVQLKGE